MLGFFRRHQKYFYVIITIVIVISFSFFGTYSTLQSNAYTDPVAFTAVDGTEVTRSELEEMVLFLGTDNEDKILFGGAWGPNFLNDGVIKEDILATGLGEKLQNQYQEPLADDLRQRARREKAFRPYVHPQADFIQAETVWQYFVPGIPENLAKLKRESDPASSEAFTARVRLFLEERQFPSPVLRQMLQYQEKQYPWVNADPALARTDLSLFGYHTVDDWFGPKFLRLAAQFIINSAIIAQEKGYVVTKEEALANLLENSQTSYQQNLQNPNLGVATHSEYFSEQLRRLGMEQKRAVEIWQKVLLFRRLFQSTGNAVAVSPFSYRNFAEFSKQYVSGSLYQLPEAIRLGSFGDLQQFQIYVKAVAKPTTEALIVPTEYRTPEEVKKEYPELVRRKFLLQVREASKDRLQTRVGVKETWDWQVQDENWAKLKKEFPDLGIAKAGSREERFAALDRLNPKTRLRVDAYSRDAIVDENPDWINAALEQAEPEEMAVSIGKRGGRIPFQGVKDRERLLQLLSEAPLNEGPSGELKQFSEDGRHYYAILVQERSQADELLSFADAQQSGALSEILDRMLGEYYLDVRKLHSSDFQNSNGSWKEFSQVKDAVAKYYFADVLAAIEKMSGQSSLTPDRAASYRLYSYVNQALKELKANPQSKEVLRSEESGLENQWKLTQETARLDKGSANEDIAKLFDLSEGEWSELVTPPNGDLSFFHVEEKGVADSFENIAENVMSLHDALSADAQQILMRDVLERLEKQDAIQLPDMQRSQEE